MTDFINTILLHGDHGLKYSDLPIMAGIIMSILHVISGPDHLAAVTPLAIESKKKSWTVGFAWGIGHTLGMLIIGVLFIIFKEYINIDVISTYGEQIVGFLLVAIGVWALYKVNKAHGSKSHKHVHPHAHGDEVHIHGHSHKDGEVHKHKHTKPHRQNIFSALGIGTIHGIAGVSHLIAILPTLALPSRTDSVMYLSGFGAGTIIAMIAYAFTLGVIAKKTDDTGSQKISIFLRIFGGAIAIFVGVYWILETL
jgi:ABC-type nickel/cobalt efflux system permease component RcnA